MPSKETPNHEVYLLLGSNLNDPVAQLEKARGYIRQQIGPVIRASAVYQTAAWGLKDQPDFLNQVLIVHTSLDAPACMNRLLSIEQEMGRIRTVKNAARVIDIDILYYDRSIIRQPGLDVPHPRIAARRFVLVPLNEISPNKKDPATGLRIHDMLLQCADPLNVKKI